MAILLGLLADSHIAEQASRTNFLTLWNRKMWQHIDAYEKDEYLTLHRPASHDYRALNSAAEFIRSLSAELDLLILLGDLATTGQDKDIMAAKQFFADPTASRQINRKLQPAIGGLGVRMHFVPGNHDRYQDDKGTPGGELFNTVFAEHYQPINSVCVETVCRDGITLGVISADFCYRKNEPVGYMKKLGWGYANAMVLGELDRQTSIWQKKYPGMPVIWAIHFSPGEKVHWTIRLENRKGVIELAKKLKVRHIFCGHTHERNHDVGSFPSVYNAGSVSSIECRANHFLHLCRVTKSKNGYELSVRDFKYDEVDDEFMPNKPSKEA